MSSPGMMLSSVIGTFASFNIVAVLTNGGPLGTTRVFATYAFSVGILGSNLPLGANVSLRPRLRARTG